MKNDMNFPYKPAPPAARRIFALAMRFAMLSCLLVIGQSARAQTLGKYFPLYISSYGDNTIYKLDSSGNRTVFTSGGNINGAHAIAFDAHGNLYVSSVFNSAIVKVNSAGQQSVFTSAGLISGPRGLAFDRAGNLYVESYDNSVIVKVDATGNQTLFASGPYLSSPRMLAFDAAGNLYADNTNGGLIVKIDSAGNQSVYSYTTGRADGLAFDSNGLLWAASIDYYQLGAIQGDGTWAVLYSAADPVNGFWQPEALAFDYKGTLWASDFSSPSGSFRVGTVSLDTPDGIATINSVTSTTSLPAGLAFSQGYTTTGFAAPIANPPAVNTGKVGRTYPVKWTMTNPGGSFATSLSAVSTITYTSVPCGSFGSGTSNPLTTTTTGNSSLRYDSTANQYIYNWATPSTPGCYDLIVTLDSQQTLTAYFNLN